jgi:ABC-type Fe3+/spermidine/putrescine transport system ATPase subunit
LAGAGPPIESGIGTPARSSGDSTGESAGTNTPHGATELKAPPPHPRGFAPVGVSSRHLPSTGLPLESGVARDVRGAILLEAKGLVRSFGRFNAVDGVDLEVAPGTITGLIGPNGAGKSTLFNLIAGALPPTAGAIRFEGGDITGLPPNRIFTLGLARTFQIPRPFPRMTVLENAMLVPLHQSGERFWSNWLAGRRVARLALAGSLGNFLAPIQKIFAYSRIVERSYRHIAKLDFCRSEHAPVLNPCTRGEAFHNR